jgi:hypothetical protein
MLMQIAQNYDDIAHFKFGRQHVYLVNKSEYIENILIKDCNNFIENRDYWYLRGFWEKGL